MKFKKNNKIRFFQDFNMHEGIPADIDFSIYEIIDQRVELIARGFEEHGEYRDGTILVSLTEFSVRDRVLIEKEFNALKNNKHCTCSCQGGCK
jgi:hypothetical protein